jgi:hypothetical protein
MGRDRAKKAARKAKGKASSSSQSEHDSSAMGDMLSTLKMSTTFAKVQLWKKWNKLKECSTADMDETN